MKKIQCTKCGQVFWTELQVDEALIGSGEWIQSPCPRCGAEWAVVEPRKKRPAAKARKKGKPGPKRRRKAAQPSDEKAPVFSPARIRTLRRKLGISQKQLASLAGVSTNAVVSWERGKFKPKKDKVAQLASLAGKAKEEVRNLLAEKKPKHLEGEKPEEVQVEKPKGNRKERMKKKPIPSPKELKS